MPRAIRIGDRVQAFLDANILGNVVSMSVTSNHMWTVGGAPSKTRAICRIKLASTGEVVDVAKSELFIVDY